MPPQNQIDFMNVEVLNQAFNLHSTQNVILFHLLCYSFAILHNALKKIHAQYYIFIFNHTTIYVFIFIFTSDEMFNIINPFILIIYN